MCLVGLAIKNDTNINVYHTNVTYTVVKDNANTLNWVSVIRWPRADPPQARGFWAQASDSLAPPAEQDCPCHHLSDPWSTGQTLRTYCGRHCLNPAERWRTAPPRHQTPWQECKLNNKWEKKDKMHDYLWSYSCFGNTVDFFSTNLFNTHLDKQSQQPKKRVQQQWGSYLLNRCELCETNWWNPTHCLHHCVSSLPAVELHRSKHTHTHNRKEHYFYSTCKGWTAVCASTHSLSDTTAVLDALYPPPCHSTISDPPETICWLQLLWLFLAAYIHAHMLITYKGYCFYSLMRNVCFSNYNNNI